MNEAEEAYKILRVKPGCPLEQILSQYKLLSVMWNPDRVNEESEKRYAQEEFDKINWAKSYLENCEERVLRIENKSPYRLDLKTEMPQLSLDEDANTIYFPKAQNVLLGQQLLYVGGPMSINRWRVTEGWDKVWEFANPGPRFFLAP